MRRLWLIFVLLFGVALVAPGAGNPLAPHLYAFAATLDATPASSAPEIAVPGATGTQTAGEAVGRPAPATMCSDQGEFNLPKCAPGEGRRRAQREFREALKAQEHRHPHEALEHFEAAVVLAPDNVEYVTTREVARQKLVYENIERGNAALAAGKTIQALGAFREALDLDPENQFARQRLQDSLPKLPKMTTVGPVLLPLAIQLQPDPGTRNFHLRGNARDIIAQVALGYGITAIFDDSVASRPVRLDMEEATWPMAFSAIARLTKTLWTPLSARQALFAADTDENRRSLERTASRTFYLPQASTPQILNEIAGVLRTLFEIRFVNVNATATSITVRANARVLEAVSQFLEALEDAQPEVTFEIDVYQVTATYARAIGANVPTQWQLFNIPTELQSALHNSSVQGLVNQLISSGLINQANTTAVAGLIAQLLGQQGSIFSQPFAVFGGGLTLSALTLPGTSFSLSRDISNIKSLQKITLRASQNTPAVLKIGERFPILNSTFAPVFNSSAISAVLGNQTYKAPFPSYNYVDIGLSLKATPIIQRDNTVSLKVELQINALGTQTVNGIPVLDNRQFNGFISAKDGESIVAAGYITRSESRVLLGWPGLGALPGVGLAFSSRQNQETNDELLVVLTPHVVIGHPRAGESVMLPYQSPR